MSFLEVKWQQNWWAVLDSNQRLPPCEDGTLTTELTAQFMAGPMGLEPTTSGVTGRRSHHLNYDPAWWAEQVSNL